ncbi:hypothetical protein [Flavobacterium limnosediminis]|uniref:hypothetical protein n=1 Tax=Flavobacterium limnosediminis TaxID=1401027 RepID=UPI000414BAF4|nr:hypothetical protein [Flavobacterium limnosediminis]
MNNFKDFGIKPVIENFTGDKIKIEKLLNQEIIVLKFRIVPSNYEGKRLDLQIQFKDEMRVVWTTAKYLIQTIEKISEDHFPFKTTIKKVDEHLEFS